MCSVRQWAVLTGAVALVIAAGCSKDAPGGHAVVAKVNDEAISIQRFRRVVAQASQQSPRAPEPGEILEKLIERQLLAQKAVKTGLARDPAVTFAIDDFREQVLAQAYVEDKLGASPVLPVEVRRYYDEHPSYFRERRFWRVFELAVVAPPGRVAELRRRAYLAGGLQPVVDWLKTRGIAFNVAGTSAPSERIAPDLLAALERMREGEIRVIDTPRGASVLQLVQAQPAPLSIADAAPGIERMLRAGKRAEVAAAETRYLRSVAVIEHVLDYGRKENSQPEEEK